MRGFVEVGNEYPPKCLEAEIAFFSVASGRREMRARPCALGRILIVPAAFGLRIHANEL
jgi:hypothetical protein